MERTVKENALNRILARIFDKEVGLLQEKEELTRKLQEVEKALEEIKQERRLLRLFGDNEDLNFVQIEDEVTETEEKANGDKVTRTHKKRYTKRDRIDVENTVEEIAQQYGRPMKVSEIIDELADHGYEWNNYVTAHRYISTLDSLEKIKRGYYQLIKQR